MEKGQSTIEVAIAFPVLIIMLWWACVPPLVGVRALAARSAAMVGARGGAVQDELRSSSVEEAVGRTWTGLAGVGQDRRVQVDITGPSLSVSAQERTLGWPAVQRLSLHMRRERD